jgi:hypothetical protein
MGAVALVLGLVAALVFSSSGTANPPTRFTFSLDDTFPALATSAVCGFDVFVHIEGTATAQLFYDQNGVLIRELDTNPSLQTTFFAPSTGASFTFPAGGSFVQDYVNGTAIGSTLVATLTGYIGGTGSTAPNAGRIVFESVIVDISPEGIPVVDLVSEISSSGHFNEDTAAARCAALSS